jgi:glycosyltransferase involved in cell wall biosynthesis
MSRVTVVVPTAGRPETLEVTLRCIARQNHPELIRDVIVSENRGDRRSQDVCALFPELPITYRFREPQLPVAEHICTALQEAEGELTAFVCDDDLWGPGHLESAVVSLDAHPEAVAHFSAFVRAESELARTASFWAAPLLWLAAGRPSRMSEYVMSPESVFAVGWMVAPFQWSTLVGRTPVVKAAAPGLSGSEHSNYYGDVMLCLAIARQGTVVFDPAVDTLYRSVEGAGEWQRAQDPLYLRELLRDWGRQVSEMAMANGWDVAALWRSYLADLPPSIAPLVGTQFAERFTDDELRTLGFAALLPPVRQRSTADKVGARLSRAWKALTGAVT